MICPTCKGTGIQKIELFTSVEYRPCPRGCRVPIVVKRLRLESGCLASREPEFIGALFKCDSGHWHTRGDFLKAKEDAQS